MTKRERVALEHRLSAVEDRAKSNTKRLNTHEALIKENSKIIGAINEMAIETKHMSEAMNKMVVRLDKLEGKENNKWDKFKWLIVAAAVTIVASYIAATIGLK